MNIQSSRVLLIIIICLTYSYSELNAQCLNFVRTTGYSKLDTSKYTPSNRLNAVSLSEGDILDVYKPFFIGRKYKIIVACDNGLPLPRFIVKNFQSRILFDSKESDNTDSWVFEPVKNQNLIISLEIPKSSADASKSGCVAVVIGVEKGKEEDSNTSSGSGGNSQPNK